MKNNRLVRVNSLLKEVLFEVIQKEVRNPEVNRFVSISKVEASPDLHHAKVYISLIGTDAEKEKVLHGLQSAAGFIAVQASKKVEFRHFPTLTFFIDQSADDHMRIEKILSDLEQERNSRSP